MTGYDPIPVGYVKRISRTNANEFDTSDGLFRAQQHPSSHCPPRDLGGGSSWAVGRPVFDAVMSTPTPVGGPSASTPLKMSTAIEAVEVSALPYAFFSPLAQLFAAQGDEAGLDGLLVGRRYDLSAMACVKRACDGQRAKIVARLATLAEEPGSVGIVLRQRAPPSLLVVPLELLRLAVIMTALTLYAKPTERHHMVSADAICDSMSSWAWMPAAKGNAPWGAVAPADVATILASLKMKGVSHSIMAGLLRNLDRRCARRALPFSSRGSPHGCWPSTRTRSRDATSLPVTVNVPSWSHCRSCMPFCADLR